ncbi:MAG: A/G-specific adenine glycosylase [Desulfobulbaceae bacterium]|nr:A/G-specific adenine glycosylase [Desulfobulbaceae bacterium]
MKKGKGQLLFRNALLDWFGANQRDLPWRRTYDPYHIWVSEVMLQQTQMERGVEYFNRWMERFPDIRSLADASEQEVLKAWEGLGYYSRARNIRAAADVLLAEYGGVVPEDYAALLALPGIGPYTAAAVMSIAFNQPYPVIDANVERLFARIDNVARPMKEKAVYQNLEKILATMLRTAPPRDFNQALMELGALVCRPRNPLCGECPLGTQCRALAAGTVMQRPVLPPRKETIDIVMACAILKHNGKFFIQQRRSDDVWGGLWEFPGGRLKNGESAAQAAARELYEETELRAVNLDPFRTVTHHYTRYRVTLHAFFCNISKVPEPRLHAATAFRWVALDELDRYPFPSGHRQLIAHMKR